MITNITERERAQQFRDAARWITEISRRLTSSANDLSRQTFNTEYRDEAEKAIEALENLIAVREYEILQAQEAIEDYRAAIANGGQEALTQIREVA